MTASAARSFTIYARIATRSAVCITIPLGRAQYAGWLTQFRNCGGGRCQALEDQ
jgi:hypothetical protein